MLGQNLEKIHNGSNIDHDWCNETCRERNRFIPGWADVRRVDFDLVKEKFGDEVYDIPVDVRFDFQKLKWIVLGLKFEIVSFK